MSERNFAILVCPLNLEEPSTAVGWLSQFVDQSEFEDVAKFIAVNTKFKAPHGIRTFNLEASYPAELATLTTHANRSRIRSTLPIQYYHARALYCLVRFAEAHPDINRIALITDEFPPDFGLATLMKSSASCAFGSIVSPAQDSSTLVNVPVLFDRRDPAGDLALRIALDLALTGAIYAIAPYSFQNLLHQAAIAAALRPCRALAGEIGTIS